MDFNGVQMVQGLTILHTCNLVWIPQECKIWNKNNIEQKYRVVQSFNLNEKEHLFFSFLTNANSPRGYYITTYYSQIIKTYWRVHDYFEESSISSLITGRAREQCMLCERLKF